MKQPNKHGNYPCDCCGYFTLSEGRGNTFEICPVCWWEDDGVQQDDPTYWGGANVLNQIDARINFAKYGAMEERFVVNARPPMETELPDVAES